MKAAIPSTASCVRIRSSKYSRSISGSTVRTCDCSAIRIAATPCRSAAAERGASVRANHASTTLVERARRGEQLHEPASSATPLPSWSRRSPGCWPSVRSPTRAGSSTEPAGGKTPERNFGKREGRILFREDEVARQRQLESATETAPAHQRGGWCGRIEQVVDQRVHLGQHPADLAPVRARESTHRS